MKQNKLLEVRFVPLQDKNIKVQLFYCSYAKVVSFVIVDRYGYDMLLDILGLCSLQVGSLDYYIEYKPNTRYFRIISSSGILKLPFSSTYVNKNTDLYLLCTSLN